MGIPTSESHNNSSRKQRYTAEEALSEWEINAVMQLVQLSSANPHSDHHREDDNSSNNNFSFFSSSKVNSGQSVDVASSSYSSSSPAPVAAVLLSTEAEKGESAQEDHDGGGRCGIDWSKFGGRRNNRYRSIVELYRVTARTTLRCYEEEEEFCDDR